MKMIPQQLPWKKRLNEVYTPGNTNLHDIRVLYQNVRGLRTKFDKLRLLSVAFDYEIIILVETWLHTGIFDEELSMIHFFIFRSSQSDRSENMGGGVLIGVRIEIRSRLIQTHGCGTQELYVECLFHNVSWILGAIYIPPLLPRLIFITPSQTI